MQTNGLGAGGSGGLPIVVPSQYVFADNTARDTYFTGHAGEKVVGLYIIVGSSYQQWSGSAWVVVTSIAQGPAGAAGSNGTVGTGYAATSSTSLATAGTGTKTFTTQSGLAYLVGTRARATSAGTGEWMEGVVSSYSGTSLAIAMDSNSGTGTHTDWNFSVAGARGPAGAAGTDGTNGTNGADGDAPASAAFSSAIDLSVAGGGTKYAEHDMTGAGTIVFTHTGAVEEGNALVCLIGSGSSSDKPDWATNFIPDDYAFVSTANARNLYSIVQEYSSPMVFGRQGQDASGGGGGGGIFDETWPGAASASLPAGWVSSTGTPTQNGDGTMSFAGAGATWRDVGVADCVLTITVKPDNQYPYIVFRESAAGGAGTRTELVFFASSGKLHYQENTAGTTSNEIDSITTWPNFIAAGSFVVTITLSGSSVNINVNGNDEITTTASVGLTNTFMGLAWAATPLASVYSFGEVVAA